MNSKGTTLMETLTAIFILSIAGLMITTGFVTVIRVTSDANTIKNQSDGLLALAEGKSGDEEAENLKKEINSTPLEMKSVNITNTMNNKSVVYKGSVATLEYKDNPKVKLYELQDANLLTVFSERKEAFTIVENYHQRVEKLLDDTGVVGSKQSYNDIFLQQEWIGLPPVPFPSNAMDILPKKWNNKQLYIQEFFPWEYKETNEESVFHGGSLMFLSKGSIFGLENYLPMSKEVIHFIYDYKNECWLYQESDKYVIYYDIGNNFKYRKSCIRYNSNPEAKEEDKKYTFINNSTELDKYINSKEEGWKRLYKGTILNLDDPDSMWK